MRTLVRHVITTSRVRNTYMQLDMEVTTGPRGSRSLAPTVCIISIVSAPDTEATDTIFCNRFAVKGCRVWSVELWTQQSTGICCQLPTTNVGTISNVVFRVNGVAKDKTKFYYQ